MPEPTDRGSSVGRRLPRLNGRAIRHILTREITTFGVADTVYLLLLYIIGSYIIFDTPLNLTVLILYLFLFHSKHRLLRRFALFAVIAAFVALTISGIAIPLTDRLSPVNSRLRVFHQLFSRYALLATLPYLASHVHQSLQSYPAWYRNITRAGWVTLKISIWVGAFVALLTIRGLIIPYHVWAMVVAIPLVLLHVVASWFGKAKPDPTPSDAIRPIAVKTHGSPLLYSLALIVGMGLVAATWLKPNAPQWQFVNHPNFMVSGQTSSLAPSVSTLPQGEFIHPQFLAKSNTCGTDECHPVMYNEWVTSPHRHSVGDKYVSAQQTVIETEGVEAARICASCHDPVSLYAGAVTFGQHLPTLDGKRDGISCIVCHRMDRNRSEDTLGNGSVSFTPPPYYHIGPKRLVYAVGMWRHHEQDFSFEDRDPNAPCRACHTILPFDSGPYTNLSRDWLETDLHAQAEMEPQCRSNSDCIDCHLARRSIHEKPRFLNMRDHGFARPFTSDPFR